MTVPQQKRQVLSLRAIQGRGGAPRLDHARPEIRYSAPESLAGYLRRANQAGFDAVMTLSDETAVAGLRRYRAEKPEFAVYPVVPNVLGYVREATEYGLAGAGLRRLRRVGPLGFLRASLAGMLNARLVLKKHFPTLLEILYELELGEFRRFDPPVVFLHQQITDLALAFRNAEILRRFAACCRERFGCEPGLVTANFTRLAALLEEHKLEIALICAPLNREYFLMSKSAERYARALASGRFRIFADRISIESPAPAAAIAWALEQPGVCAAVADFLPDGLNGTHGTNETDGTRGTNEARPSVEFRESD